MPKKGFLKKKKKFQRLCREMAKAGKVNAAGGNFIPASSKTTDTMLLKGYKLGG